MSICEWNVPVEWAFGNFLVIPQVQTTLLIAKTTIYFVYISWTARNCGLDVQSPDIPHIQMGFMVSAWFTFFRFIWVFTLHSLFAVQEAMSSSHQRLLFRNFGSYWFGKIKFGSSGAVRAIQRVSHVAKCDRNRCLVYAYKYTLRFL